MNKVIIIGAGGHAAEINDYISHFNQAHVANKIEVLGFLDDNKENYEHYKFDKPFLGNIIDHVINPEIEYIMGIANIKYRKPIVQLFLEKGAVFLTLIHPTALVSPTAVIEKGCIISHNVSIGPKAIIGQYNIINSRCTIGHDTQIGDFNFIGPQVVLSGHTKIGENNMIGVNVATIPSIKIGNHNIVAAGMIVDKNIGDDEILFYRHKEKIIISK